MKEIGASGIESDTMGLPVQEGSIESLFQLIIKGLTWSHWGTYLPQDFPVDVNVLTQRGQALFQERFFSLRAGNRVLENLGDGTVIYEGIQGVDCPEITVWRFRMYGGMVLAADGGQASTEIAGMSGPEKVMNTRTT